MSAIDRRSSLFLVSGLLIAGVDKASGQSAVKYTGEDISSGLELQHLAVGASPETGFVDFVVTSFNDRRKAVRDASKSGVYTDTGRAVSVLKSSIGITVPGIPKDYFSAERINSQVDVIVFMDLLGVPLIPDVNDIFPIGIPVVEPIKQKNEDTDLGVILDIAFQTMGIFKESS